MDAAFQAVRFPVSVVWGIFLAVALPFWLLLGVLLCVLGTLFLPFMFLKYAFANDRHGLSNYIHETYDVGDWLGGYRDWWKTLAYWQRTGRKP
jgi:hypothetical protein